MYRQGNKICQVLNLIFCMCLEIVYNTKVEGLWLFIKNKQFEKILKKKNILKEI